MWGQYWGYIGMTENKVETTILDFLYICKHSQAQDAKKAQFADLQSTIVVSIFFSIFPIKP